MQEEQKNKRQQEQVRRNNDQINIVFKRDIFLTPLMKNQLKNIDVCQFIIQNMFKSPITIKKQLEQIKQLFNSISQWRIVCLIVNGTDGANLPIPTILKQIQNIKFHQLIRLNLWKCQIQTIQNLSIIQMPELQQLWLDSNYIISIKSLIRCHLPKLKQLSIRNNFIVECQDLCLIYLSKLQIIVLEYWGQDRDICKMTNLIKIQSPAINQIHTQSQSKIKQDNIVNKLFNKFSHEQINIYGGYHI